ncbi:hypothetical protein [Corynebacterium sp. A21]|uniref:hypothetical protein n=1 Tax=Corynebacterium sp. A21 TaxID=3457318 RepID=UPI003FD2D207
MSTARLTDLEKFTDRELRVIEIKTMLEQAAATKENGRLLAEIHDRLDEIADATGVPK